MKVNLTYAIDNIFILKGIYEFCIENVIENLEILIGRQYQNSVVS